MSIQAMQWAFEQDVGNSSAKFLLVCLADNVGNEGVCFPSIDLLCKKTNQDRKTIISNLDLLEELCLIQDTGNRVGNGIKEYRFIGIKDPNTHYVYCIKHKQTGEFYIGVRSVCGSVDSDKYIGSGAWAIKQKPSEVEKLIIGVYNTRKEAELAELFYIDKNKENPLIKNRYFPKKHLVPKAEPVPKTELQPVPNLGQVPNSEPVPNFPNAVPKTELQPVPNLDGTSTKFGTQNHNEPSIEPSINHYKSETQKSRSPKAYDIDLILSYGVDRDTAEQFIVCRREKRAAITAKVLDGFRDEAGKAKFFDADGVERCLTISEAITISIQRGWKGFNHSWNWRGVANQASASPTQSKHTGFNERDYGAGIRADGSF